MNGAQRQNCRSVAAQFGHEDTRRSIGEENKAGKTNTGSRVIYLTAEQTSTLGKLAWSRP
jgi:hypothetical protein